VISPRDKYNLFRAACHIFLPGGYHMVQLSFQALIALLLDVAVSLME
jgi:hypothetical protein